MAKTPPRGKSPAKKQPPRAAAPKPRKAPVKAPEKAPVKAARPPPAPVVPEVPVARAPVAPRRIAVEVEPPAPPRSAPKALPAGEPVDKGATFPLELDPKRIEEGLKKLQNEVAHWANKGRYTKVRFKFRGKQLLPDLPLAAVAAAEGLTFYWGGVLRLLIANVVGNSVLQVEFVNDADKRVQAGREALLSGDVEQALSLFREALVMDRDNAAAHLNVGVALKLKGDREAALVAFEKARKSDPEGPTGAEAERLAVPLRPKGVA
ncbi:Tetratricopeptide repeat-containing protein [Stigmatella aurantiaca]|uniref:Tetratricopeptide repeat-containing protein n=1 Tax=Stigmatella aurantiaca TaxID=41 RepID=A0A1H8A162_STIAU|nr:tetratricopeptide repeat protein [Stigmatella aurantiaca]SEM63654.1 Tetratricopeptide repeat-containing protein [Stigmatella aurantiaca]